MMTSLSGNANEVYPILIQQILDNGDEVRPRGTVTLELSPALLNVHRANERLVTAWSRPINVAFSLAEVLWILAGREDVAMLAAYNSQISNYSDNGRTFNAAYGHRLRHTHHVDQLEDMIMALQRDPDTRQAELTIAHPGKDKSFEARSPHLGGSGDIEWSPRVTKDRACNVFSHAMIRKGKLTWLQVVRSNDAIWGVPYNLMQWTHVMEYVAARVGVPMGDYRSISDSMHIYAEGESAKEFTAARNIREFNLYEQLEATHHAMEAVGIRQLEELCMVERQMRDAGSADELHKIWAGVNHNLAFWRDLLGALAAHRLFNLHKGDISLGLKNFPDLCVFTRDHTDPIYEAALLRFWHSVRWHSWPELERQEIRSIIGEQNVPPEAVLRWICNEQEASA